jgi:rhamnose utilization protein RhaD (predicted bifunctional aldolase and dehydrogenase)
MSDVRSELIDMSRTLGDETLDLAILGEGNTSARADDESFWVKASGTELARADETTFVRVQFAPSLAALERETLSDAEIKQLLRDVTVEGDRVPSIETFLHAMCLKLDGVRFVGHTHPTAAVGLLCSVRSRELFRGSLFPRSSCWDRGWSTFRTPIRGFRWLTPCGTNCGRSWNESGACRE